MMRDHDVGCQEREFCKNVRYLKNFAYSFKHVN